LKHDIPYQGDEIMSKQILMHRIASLIRLRRMQRGVEGLVWGLFLSGLGVAILFGLRLIGTSLPLAVGLLPIITGIVCFMSVAVGWAWPVAEASAARAIDSRYGLKDRTLTALLFSRRDKSTPIEALQLSDAVQSLESTEPRQVSPWQPPRGLPFAIGACTLAAILFFVPPRSTDANPIPGPLDEVLAIADQLEEDLLEDVEKLAEENPEEEELEKLAAELRDMVDELREAGIDGEETLARISEMEAAISDAMAEFDLEAMDASFEELGDAMSASEELRPAADALRNGEYAEAAEELENADPSEMTNRESQAVSESLSEASESMSQRGQEEMAEVTGELCEGIREGELSECQNAAEQLAQMARTQGLREGICQSLGCQLQGLASAKSQCAGGLCQSDKNGGFSDQLSDTPSEKWGRGTVGDPLGDEATSLDGQRQAERLTGMAGEGPSEVQTLRSANGTEEAARSYSEVYAEYERMTESVLESEPIPLGHRAMIRDYFERIRPTEEDFEESGSDAGE
jgi:hypothetical protein